MIEQYLEEAQILRESGDFKGAEAACHKALEIENEDARPHFLLGLLAVGRTKLDEASKHFAAAAKFNPDNPHIVLHHAQSLTEFGEFEKAEQALTMSLEKNPAFIPAYLNLFNLGKVDANNPHIGTIETLIKDGIKDQYDESLAYYALGKAYDDIGEYDKAFPNFQTANELQGKIYDHQNTLTMFGRVKEVFTPALMKERKGSGNLSQTPVFIVGMPRSGSTLIEDLLCRNPDVVGFGERTEAAQIIMRMESTHPSHTPYPEICAQIPGDQFGKLGELYLHLLEQVKPLGERIVDKNILNHSIIGVLRLMFSNGSFIHAVRDPIDTCLSSYFQIFMSGLEFTYDLEHLGQRYAAYADLMDHWHNALGGEILKVDYEDLTQNNDAVVAQMFDHIGIAAPDDAALKAPAERAVSTASAWQVRQPIYKTSLKRWKNYENHLGPLFDALAASGFDYKEQ